MDKVGKAIEVVVKVAVTLVSLGVLLVFPLLFVYELIAPLFGSDPIGYAADVVSYLVALAVLVIVGGALFSAFILLSDRSKLFRKFVGFIVCILLVLGTINQCTGHSSEARCVPNRYVEC